MISMRRQLWNLPLRQKAILSTLVADGYVGTYLGMYASSGGNPSSGYADFDWFRYEIIEE